MQVSILLLSPQQKRSVVCPEKQIAGFGFCMNGKYYFAVNQILLIKKLSNLLYKCPFMLIIE